MRILFYFGHPSQYYFLRPSIIQLKKKGILCDIVIKSKDILEKLLIDNNEQFSNILPEGRKSGRVGLFLGLIKRNTRLLRHVKGKKYNLFIGTDPSLAHIGFIKRIPVITVLEDDIHIVKDLARLTFPFTTLILTPEECVTGKFEKKTIHYSGYMKLAYLHPQIFIKAAPIFKQPYFLIRVSKLDAYHDKNISGLSNDLLNIIVRRLKQHGDVYISVEGEISSSLKNLELKINPNQMHNVLANAKFLISDSQSMTMEAAMLGVPSIRYSDFAGKINVLEALEHRYGLTFGINASSPDLLFRKINELFQISNLEEEFQARKDRMLEDKINVTSFLIWFITNFPNSLTLFKKNPEIQFYFK